MARLQNIIGGVLVLSVTVLLNTRPAEAANCATAEVCKNDGTCPDPNNAPCDCSASDYVGDTCETEVCTSNSDCNTETCDTNATPKVCKCGVYKGKTCADACEDDADCLNGGNCTKNGANNVCSCGDYKGDMCADECAVDTDCGTDGTCETSKKCTCKDSNKEGPGCKKDKSGASAVTSFSLMSLCVILIGYLL